MKGVSKNPIPAIAMLTIKAVLLPMESPMYVNNIHPTKAPRKNIATV